MSADLFISYASADRERVIPVVEMLEATGYSCWIDYRNIAGGAEWNQAIVEAIRACRTVIVMCSAASMRSHNVRQEIRLAWSPDVRYIPVLLEDIGRSFPDQISYFLEGFQWVNGMSPDLSNWMPRLIEAIDRPSVQAAPELVGISNLPDEFLGLLQTSRLADTIWPEPYPAQRQNVLATRDLGEAPERMQHTFRIGDHLQLVIESDREGHLLLFDIGTTGKIYCLCPSEFIPDTRISIGHNVFPRAGAKYPAFQATGVPGREHLFAIISDEQMELSFLQDTLERMPGPAQIVSSPQTEEVVRLASAIPSNSWTSLASYFEIVRN